MPVLVHITRRENASQIVRTGIKPGKYNKVVFFMPLSSGFSISHQWVRELKRSGGRNFSAIHFRLPSSTMIWYGHYNFEHFNLPLGEAIHDFLTIDDQLGYQFYFDHKIDADSIDRVESIPKPVGWRFSPTAHGRKPCFCPVCSRRGEYGQSKRVKAWRKENEDPEYSIEEARNIILNSRSMDQVYSALYSFMGKTRRDDPSFMFRVFKLKDDILEPQALNALGYFAHPKAREFLMAYNSEDLENQQLIAKILIKRGWVN